MYMEQRLMHTLRRVVHDGCVACGQWRPLPAKRLRWCLWVAQATSAWRVLSGAFPSNTRIEHRQSPVSDIWIHPALLCRVRNKLYRKEGERGYTQGAVDGDGQQGLQAGVTLREWGMRPENLSSRPRYRSVTMIITQIYRERGRGRARGESALASAHSDANR